MFRGAYAPKWHPETTKAPLSRGLCLDAGAKVVLEPTRFLGPRILSPLRLLIPPLRQRVRSIADGGQLSQKPQQYLQALPPSDDLVEAEALGLAGESLAAYKADNLTQNFTSNVAYRLYAFCSGVVVII